MCSPLHPTMVIFGSSTKHAFADSQDKVCSASPLLSKQIYVGIYYDASFAIHSSPAVLVNECY